MNKIYKVIYSKVRQCYVVVSELAKNQGKKARSEHTMRENNRSYRLAAIVALTISAGSLLYPMQAEAVTDLSTNNYFTAYDKNYFDKDGKRSEDWNQVEPSNTNQDKDRVGAKNTGAIAAGMFAQAGQQTVTIGNRNAGQSMGSVFIGEYKGYYNPSGNQPQGLGNNYVTSVGFMSNATKYGTIAIGAGASAEGEDNSVTLGDKDPSGTLVSSLPDPDKLTIHGASVSLGYSAQSEHGNIAIGAYSDATTDLSDGKSDTPKSYLTGNTATSYVSVGSKNVQRRISNVADGADATDVATVGQLQALSKELGGYKAGFGIQIDTDSTDKTKNTIGLKRNLGRDANTRDKAVLKADEDKSALVIGGRVNQGDATGGQTTEKDYGALGQDSVTVGGADNTASGDAAVVIGGLSNTATAQYSAVVGGSANDAIGNESSVFGGFDNDANGMHATISGGSHNRTYGDITSVFGGSMNNAVGSTSSVFGGSINTATGTWSSVIGGSHNTALGLSSTAVGGENAIVDGMNSVGIAGGSTNADYALAAGNEATVTVNNGTAIGYQATANQEGTVAFGHDKGDVYYTSTWPQKATEKDGKYYDAKNEEITKDQYEALKNADLTFNDYSQKPTVTENKYDAAAYNRLVKVADGQDDHDVVVMEQLKQYANKDASNIGSNITVPPIYQKDEKGQKVVDQKATEDAQKAARTANENAWGTAIGTGKVADPTQSEKNDPTQNGSQQLVTGGEVYNALHGGLTDITVGKAGKDGTDGKDGSIGLNGKNGKDGKDGITTTIIKTEKGQPGKDGKDGAPGVDGKDITRIVYQNDTNGDGKHTVATLDDGMKYVGDTGATANVKLDHQLKLSGTTFNEKDENKKYKEADWTSGNIAVVSGAADDKTGDATMYLKLAKDLKNLNSSTYTTTKTTGEGDQQKTTTYTTVINGKGLTIQSGEQGSTTSTSGPSITIDGIDGGGKQITNVGNGITTDTDGNYTIADADKTNAANIGDVQTIVNKATKDLTDGTNGLNNKANVDASNIGSNIKVYKTGDDKTPVLDDEATKQKQTENENAWGKAIGTGKVADPTKSEKNDPTQNGSQQLVTGGEVYNALHGGLTDITVGKAGKDGKDGKDGSIGLVGQTGQKGEDGKNAYATTIIKTEKGVDGVDGKNGEDGITRIVYNDTNDPANKHTVATLDDGMKYVGDTGATANVKLDHQLKLSGTTFDETDENKKYKDADWTSDNIAVVSNATDETTGDATMYLKLNKNLNLTDKGSVRFGDKNSSTTLDASGLTIKSTVTKEGNTEVVNGPSMTKDGINGGGKQITNVGNGITTDNDGNYTISDADKTNAANIGDVQTIVDKATKDLTDGTNGLNQKANVDASNIGNKLTVAPIYKKDTSTGKEIFGNDGKPIVDEDATKAATEKAREDNKNAWASAIGTDKVEAGNKQLVTSDAVATALDKKADKSYVDQELSKKADKTYVDEKVDTKANKSDVYTKNETYSKSEVDNKVTNITKGLDDKANKDLGNINDAGKQVIKNLAKGAVKVIAGTNTTVTPGTDEDGATTYAVNVEGKGKVASGDTGLISGGTLYNEVHVDKDGTYIKSKDSATGKDMTVAQNLSALDSGLKTTSDLIHTNTNGDTIQIGGNSTATKVDISGKDKDGNKTGRVITGVVSDANDPNSAANVGYVNGITSASNEQIYRDMNMQYNHVENDISRAAAGSNALAALHPMQEFDPDDKAQYALGYGHYRNSNAGAVGVFYQPDENSLFSLGASFGNGDAGINAGVTFKFGPGGSGHHALTKTQMAKVIDAQSKEIDALKKDNADKDKRIDALEQKVNEILAKVEKDKA